MKCIYCGFPSTAVTNSRKTRSSSQTWRRRKCGDCEQIFSTYEKPDLSSLTIQSARNSASPYQRFVLTTSILAVFELNKGHKVDIDALIDTIELKLVRLSQNTITSQQLAYLVLATLKPVDVSAYMRYLANTASKSDQQALQKLLAT